MPFSKCLIPLLVFLLALAGCDQPKVKVKPLPTPEPEEESTPAPTPAPTPEARLAPEGVFYFVKSISITTDEGVMSAHPGKQVRHVRNEGGNIVVTDGTHTFSVAPDYLTNDMDVVDGFTKKADAAKQAAKEAQQTNKIARDARQVEQAKLDKKRKQEKAKETIARLDREITAVSAAIEKNTTELRKNQYAKKQAKSMAEERPTTATVNSAGSSSYLLEKNIAELTQKKNAMTKERESWQTWLSNNPE